MMNSNNRYEEKFKKIKSIINKLSDRNKKELLKLADEMKDLVDKNKSSNDILDEALKDSRKKSWWQMIDYKHIILNLLPIFVAIKNISSIKNVDQIKKAFPKFLPSDTVKTFMLFFTMTVWSSVAINIIKSYYMREGLKKADSTASKILEYSKNKIQIFWNYIKSFEFKKAFEFFIKSSWQSFKMVLFWDIEIMKKNLVFAIVMSVNIVANIAIIYFGSLLLKEYIEKKYEDYKHA